MNHRVLRLVLLVVAVTAGGMPAGCGPRTPPVTDEGPLPVAWSYPVPKVVTDHVDFTGRLDSPNAVEIRPRVTGYLVKMPFKEGSEVKQDDLLFEIDPSTYKASFDQQVADVNLNVAKYDLAKADNARAKKIKKDNPAAISQQDLDKYEAQEQEAKAAVELTKAKQESAKIYLNWCKVQAPIDGLISRYYYTLGNLVNQDQTVLTTIVSLDPIYAYFDMDERTLLVIREGIRQGRIEYDPKTKDITVYMSLATDTGYPRKGTINFINNKVDPLTGTITVRGVFPNPKDPKTGIRLMSPGMFVRIRLPVSQPYSALLVAQKVILTDQGLKNVYIIDDQNKIQYRRVEPGAVQPDGLQVILKGIEEKNRIALTNLQFIRPEMEVEPKEEAMPTLPVNGRPGLAAKEMPAKPNEKK